MELNEAGHYLLHLCCSSSFDGGHHRSLYGERTFNQHRNLSRFCFQDIEIEKYGTDLGEGSLSSYLVNKDLKIFLTFLYKEKHPSLLFEKHNIRYLNLKYF